MLEGSINRYVDLPVMKNISADDLLKLRPDIGDLISKAPIGPIVLGDGTPAPISTTLPDVPSDVRPGDLIKAEDWNAVLTRLRALDGVLAALAQGTAQLTGRVNQLARQIPAPTAPPAGAKPEKDVMVDFLGSLAVREAMASNPELMAQIGKTKEVADAVVANYDTITLPILNKAATPTGPEVEGGPPVMFQADETATLKQSMETSPLFASLLETKPEIGSSLGIVAKVADVPKGGGG